MEIRDPTELVKPTKSLHTHNLNQNQSDNKHFISDERILKDAERMLYDEFAYVLDIPHSEVVPFISGQLSN